MTDAAINLAAVGLELGFAGSAGADAAAELRHLDTASGEARQHVFELCKFDLQLAFAGTGVAGKDVEDQLGAIDDAGLHDLLDVALLRRREVVVKEDKVGLR